MGIGNVNAYGMAVGQYVSVVLFFELDDGLTKFLKQLVSFSLCELVWVK